MERKQFKKPEEKEKHLESYYLVIWLNSVRQNLKADTP